MDVGVAETVAARMARFVARLQLGDIPDAVLEKARCCLLYGVGVGLCSYDTAFATTAARAAEALHPPSEGGATLFRTGRRSSVGVAVLANAAMLHGRCQEDTSGTAHLGVITIPLLLALLETRSLPYDRLLPALVAGYEIGGHLEAVFARQTVKAGFRASPTYGVFAATASCCNLMGLSAEATRSALAHAAAFAGGTLQALGEGTDEWRYQVGVAAQAGLVAAELARAGAEGAQLAFEGRQGFAQAFARYAAPPDLGNRLGEEWAILRTTFKPFPVCAHNQSVATAALHLRERTDAAAIRQMVIRIDPYVVPGMLDTGPFSRVSETLMSTAFCAAAALVRGQLDMAELHSFHDPAILDMMRRIRVETDPAIPFPACTLRATLHDGSEVEQAEPLTVADFDFSRARIVAQLHGMARIVAVRPERIDAVVQAVAAWPEGDPLALVEAFRAQAADQA